MNKPSLEQELLGTFKQQRPNTKFVNQTMQAVRRAQTGRVFKSALVKNDAPKSWLRVIRMHRALAAIAALLVLSMLSVSGYAYATGTNPVSLIRRWIEGNQVKVEYNGKGYEYGKDKSYSDAAITAYAELQQVGLVDFHAQNDFRVTRDGTEYLTPSKYTYVYPWLGTLERIDDENIYVRKQHIMEDKMLKEKADGTLVAIPKASLWFYVSGKRTDADISAQSIGKVLYVTESPYLLHIQGSRDVPAQITRYFGYQLLHSMAEFEEADQKGGETDNARRIVESPGSATGGLTSVCLNNGSDKCDEGKVAGPDGDGLYMSQYDDSGIEFLPRDGIKKASIANNPNCVPFGEGAPFGSTADKEMVLRSLDGRITSITDTAITIQTSSGAQWMLAYTWAQQQSFAKVHHALQKGDEIAGSVLSPLTDLDSRTVSDNHIYALKRFR